MNTILILEDNILQLNSLASIIEDCLEQVSVLKAPDYNTAKAYQHSIKSSFFY